MLPPQALRPVLRHFDEVDKVVSARLIRKRPWPEVALTSLLCDAMDDETAGELIQKKDIRWLRRTLHRAMPLTELNCSIETHEYPPQVERWVTQSDLALVIRFEDHLLPARRWEDVCLLQAKRLYPDGGGAGTRYTEASRFRGHDSEQHARIQQINSAFGYSLIKYLTYCPRPEALDALTQAKLQHLRNVAFDAEIFDYARGLELHSELLKGAKTLDAGIFVTEPDAFLNTFAGTYQALFRGAIPWSWFLALWLTDRLSPRGWGANTPHPSAAPAASWSLAMRLAKGDPTVIGELGALVDGLGDRPLPLLPAHTIVIAASVGADVDEERQRIRNE